MSPPTLSQAQAWRPEALDDLAGRWEDAAGRLQSCAERVEAVGGETWRGTAGEAARQALVPAGAGIRRICQALVIAAAETRTAAAAIGRARAEVIAAAAAAVEEHFPVADDGAVGPPPAPAGLLLTVGGGQPGARAMLIHRAGELTRALQEALARLGDADVAAAGAIDAAFDLSPPAAVVRPAGLADDPVDTWPTSSQDRIAGQIAAMSAAERRRLVEQSPRQVGNTDGVPWDMRVTANRINIADAILDQRRILDRPVEDKLSRAVPPNLDPGDAERLWATLHADPALRAAAIAAHDRDARQRIALYQGLLADVPDPVDPNRRAQRQIVAFDPARDVLVEVSGDLGRARAVGVLVPGLNTTIASSADDLATARRFVAGSGGDVAMITYLGGRFPTGALAAGVADAADPRYALQMAPRLVAFSEDVERRAGSRPVTYVGHSYGGSIVGTAERLGLTADRVIYVESAGAGVGVHGPADWRNRNPDVLRFAMTAPGDPIALVQGLPLGPHGADPDDMPGVIPLAAGRRLGGAPMTGLSAHGDVLDEPSDAWRTILAVIAGDRQHIRTG